MQPWTILVIYLIGIPVWILVFAWKAPRGEVFGHDPQTDYTVAGALWPFSVPIWVFAAMTIRIFEIASDMRENDEGDPEE